MRLESNLSGTIITAIFTVVSFLKFYGTDIQNNKLAETCLTISILGAIAGSIISITDSIKKFKDTK